MSKLRKTKEFYSRLYERAVELYKEGKSVKEIAELLNLSYSCVYAWVKLGRKPRKSKVEEFIAYVKTSGPLPVCEVVKKFPKHSELYLLAKQRGFAIERAKLPRKFKGYHLWYYLPEQAEELKEKIENFLKREYVKGKT